jgi:hypothetical protein
MKCGMRNAEYETGPKVQNAEWECGMRNKKRDLKRGFRVSIGFADG